MRRRIRLFLHAFDTRHFTRHPIDATRMAWRYQRRRRNIGRRVTNGGEWGTIISCPTCDGAGELHRLDVLPEPVEPQDCPA